MTINLCSAFRSRADRSGIPPNEFTDFKKRLIFGVFYAKSLRCALRIVLSRRLISHATSMDHAVDVKFLGALGFLKRLGGVRVVLMHLAVSDEIKQTQSTCRTLRTNGGLPESNVYSTRMLDGRPIMSACLSPILSE